MKKLGFCRKMNCFGLRFNIAGVKSSLLLTNGFPLRENSRGVRRKLCLLTEIFSTQKLAGHYGDLRASGIMARRDGGL